MTDLDIVDAEIVEDDMTYGEADDAMKSLALDAAGISERLEAFADEVASLWSRRVWATLGHKSWEECTAAYRVQIRLPRADRRELVAVLDERGMSTRAIAPVVGASQRTVANDLSAPEHICSPAPRVKTGLDGKSYTIPSRPEAPANVNTRPAAQGRTFGEARAEKLASFTPEQRAEYDEAYANVDPRTGEIAPAAAQRQAREDALAQQANAIEAVAHLTDTLARLSALRTPEHRARLIEASRAHPETDNPAYIEHTNPQGIRELASLLATLADEMETTP